MSGPVRLRFDPCGTPPVSRHQEHPLESEVRHLRATLRALTMIAGCRETERQRHRDEVQALELRIAELTKHSYLEAS